MKRCLFLYNSMSPFSRKKVYGGEIWRIEQPFLSEIESMNSSPSCLAFDHDGQMVALGDIQGLVSIFHLPELNKIAAFQDPQNKPVRINHPGKESTIFRGLGLHEITSFTF